MSASRGTRFGAVAAVSLLLAFAFSIVHVLRLDQHLEHRHTHQLFDLRSAGWLQLNRAPAGAAVHNTPGAAFARLAEQDAGPKPTPAASALTTTPIPAVTSQPATVGTPATSTSSRPVHSAAKSDDGAPSTVAGYPREGFVSVIDEDEIRARDCPQRRPYHSLLTVQDRPYMQWQTYAAYYHFVKQQKADYCTDMVAITRLLASPGGKADALMALLPTHLTPQLGSEKTRGFQVINRPWSVLTFMHSAMWDERIKEDYVLILEGDHLLLRPIPNLATRDEAAGFFFPYMSPEQQPDHPRVVGKWYAGPRKDVQPTGPSPAILHIATLRNITKMWYELSVELKADQESDRVFGWVLEMWGYTITCARLGVKHKVIQQLQIEPAATWHQNITAEMPYIYHYTFGLEYTFDGLPMVGQEGEWSFDKRKFMGRFPPTPFGPPPKCAHEAAHVLTRLFDEASAASPPWTKSAVDPSRDTTRRQRPAPFDTSSVVYSSVVGAGPWELVRPEYTGGTAANVFFFFEKGRAITPIGAATWAPSASGTGLTFHFCRTDELELATADDGALELRGAHYTLRMASVAYPKLEGVPDSAWSSTVAKRIIGTGPWAWAGVPTIAFLDHGRLHTPWAPGNWRPKEGSDDTIIANFVGATCEITFLDCHRFVSVRKSDGDVVHGSMQISERASRRCSEHKSFRGA